MAVQSWTNVSIIEGGFELAGYGKSFEAMGECEALDTTPLSTTGWRTFIAGNKSGSLSLEFMQDFADNTVDETLFANFGVADVPRSVITNTADGSAAYLMRGLSLAYTPLSGDVGQLAMGATRSVGSTAPLVRGALLHPSTARTTSSTGTAQQLGAVATGKTLYAALHVLSASGTTPTLDVIVQSDTVGFPSPTSRITFAQQTTTGASAWGSVAGPITDDYFRVSWTIGGTTPSFTFAVTCGFI